MDFRVATAYDAEAVVQYLRSLPFKEGRTFKVEVSKVIRKRTVAQNRLYRLWISCIASETGNSADTIHNFLARKFLGTEQVVIGSESFEQPISTTKLTTAGFTDYLNNIEAFAATELGIILPNPTDLYWSQFEDKYGNYEQY